MEEAQEGNPVGRPAGPLNRPAGNYRAMMPLPLRAMPAWAINGLTVTLGLALVQCSIHLLAGAQAAQTAVASAVCASLADVVVTTGRVARRVLAAAIASTAAACLFLAVRPYEELLVPGVAFIVFAAMLLLAWGPKAASVSFAAALALVFAMSLPASAKLTWKHVAWSVVGSAGYWIWALVTAHLLQPVWRRQAIAATALGEARLLAAFARHIEVPMGPIEQSGILEEEAALAERLQNATDLVFADDKGPSAQRDTAVLLHLIDLRDLAMASSLMAGSPLANQRQAAPKARIVAAMSRAMTAIGEHYRTGAACATDAGAEQAIRDGLAELESARPPDQAATEPDAGSLLRAKLELLRSLQRLLEPGADARLACRRADLRRYITPDGWRLDTVTVNLRPRSPVFRHALRTGVTAGLAYALARHLPWALHPQWIVLTIAAVMQGSLAQTLVRRNARILGTLAGCLIVALLLNFPAPWFLAACFLLAAGIAHAFFGIRYSVTAGAAAVMAVLQAFLAAPAAGFSVVERFADTLTGALLGWAATHALPTWERHALPSVLARATAAMRAFAIEATRLDGGHDSGHPAAPRFVRQQAYDALRAVSAIRTRSMAEPRGVQIPLAPLTAWLTAAYGVMASLSNLRLCLALYGRGEDKEKLAAAMTMVSRALDALLAENPSDQADPPMPRRELDRAAAAVPQLASRVRLAIDAASNVWLQRREMQAAKENR